MNWQLQVTWICLLCLPAGTPARAVLRRAFPLSVHHTGMCTDF
jgi:hypothetical protein